MNTLLKVHSELLRSKLRYLPLAGREWRDLTATAAVRPA